jgi:hypothetical protein
MSPTIRLLIYKLAYLLLIIFLIKCTFSYMISITDWEILWLRTITLLEKQFRN